MRRKLAKNTPLRWERLRYRYEAVFFTCLVRSVSLFVVGHSRFCPVYDCSMWVFHLFRLVYDRLCKSVYLDLMRKSSLRRGQVCLGTPLTKSCLEKRMTTEIEDWFLELRCTMFSVESLTMMAKSCKSWRTSVRKCTLLLSQKSVPLGCSSY